MKLLKSIAVLPLLFSMSANAAEPDFNEAMTLADVMYCEARGEGRVGMMAVANVVLNRVKSKRFPNTITEVIHQPWQFSCYNEGPVKVDEDDEVWLDALNIAWSMMNGKTPRITHATHYHTTDVNPYWNKANTIAKLGQIGNHIFYIGH
jgi:spore germination cell wall hydrolase CwlJ-like protein